jgi:sugar phosphate isomerase/epimerase
MAIFAEDYERFINVKGSRKMQFGMPTLIENRTLEENVSLCKELGLKFIELNMNFPEYQVEQLENTGYLVELAEREKIYYTIHLDENLNIADFNQLVIDAYLETVRRTIEVGKKLLCLRDKFGDASQPLTINMHMHHGIYITLPDRKVQMYDRDFDTYMKAFELFRSSCEEWIGDSDIKIVVENTDGFRDYEKKSVLYLLESPKFALTWDIGHSKAIKEIDVPFIMENQEHLIHFHIHDGSENPPKNHLALGDGEIDLAERLVLAKRRNARCVLETKTIEALRKSVDWLHRNELWN